MKTYTVDGYTFSVDELQGKNPFSRPDGTIKDGCAFQFFAFNQAAFQYRLDTANPEERAEMIRNNERLNRKMQAGS